MITCTKLYTDYPAAHRQHNHDGHCALIHGHNWSFEFTFIADRLDENQFVVDFGKLKWLKESLDARFDHTLLLNEDDPALLYLIDGLENSVGAPPSVAATIFPLARIVVVPNCGAEGLACYLLGKVNELLNGGFDSVTQRVPVLPDDWRERNVRVHCVRVFEDNRNHACYSL